MSTSNSGEDTNWITRLFKRWPVRVFLAAIGCTAIGCLFALPALFTVQWDQELRKYLAQWWAWGLVTPLIMVFDHRLPFSGRELGRRVAAHLAASLAFTEIYLYLFIALRAAMGVAPWSWLKPSVMFDWSMLGWQLWSWLIYWVIAGVLQAYRYYQRYMLGELRLERLERSYAEARLNSLRMQLDPHFLFNALNTISSQVERDPKLTRLMIEHLGELLRLSLESRDKQEMPLSEEISFLEHYLAIQKIRFGGRFKFETHIDPEVRSAMVPSFFFQPLIENAIRHGISQRVEGGTVTVRAAKMDGRLKICVLDDGVGLPANWSMETSAGLGLSITRERIAELHPNGAACLVVQNREGGGAAVEVSIPLHRAGEGRNDGPFA